jgi:methylated-DNA-[protein]-cysteine S-methyltransferase
MARALGTRAWRAVGTAMAKNSELITIPCHRVVRSNGEVGQYALGTDRKIDLLIEEGVEINNGRVTDFDKYIHRF